jgi:hypothetical protein
MREPVIITWIDAQRIETGLQFDEDIKEIEPIECDIIGFKLFEDDKKVIIAQENWRETRQIKYVHVIPKCSIIDIIYLKEVKEPEPKQIDRTHNKCACGNIKYYTSKRCIECEKKNKYGQRSV